MTSVHQFRLLALMLSIVIGFFSRQSGLRLPTELSNCRQWRQLLKVPYEVPLELWMRCVAPTPGDWAATRETYGPHTKRFVRIYGNELADESLASEEKPFDAGSIIVKEKLAGEPHGDADGVAFMVKRNFQAFVSGGGWEFLYFPASPDGQSTHESWPTCHKAAAARDYVFGKYPR